MSTLVSNTDWNEACYNCLSIGTFRIFSREAEVICTACGLVIEARMIDERCSDFLEESRHKAFMSSSKEDSNKNVVVNANSKADNNSNSNSDSNAKANNSANFNSNSANFNSNSANFNSNSANFNSNSANFNSNSNNFNSNSANNSNSNNNAVFDDNSNFNSNFNAVFDDNDEVFAPRMSVQLTKKRRRLCSEEEPSAPAAKLTSAAAQRLERERERAAKEKEKEDRIRTAREDASAFEKDRGTTTYLKISNNDMATALEIYTFVLLKTQHKAEKLKKVLYAICMYVAKGCGSPLCLIATAYNVAEEQVKSHYASTLAIIIQNSSWKHLVIAPSTEQVDAGIIAAMVHVSSIPAPLGTDSRIIHRCKQLWKAIRENRDLHVLVEGRAHQGVTVAVILRACADLNIEVTKKDIVSRCKAVGFTTAESLIPETLRLLEAITTDKRQIELCMLIKVIQPSRR